MPQPCKVCHHPSRAEIDRRLLSGEAAAAVARTLGLTKQAVNRHAKNHLRPAVQATAIRSGALKHPGAVVAAGGTVEPGEMIELTSLLRAMQRNLKRLEQAADGAAGEGSRLAVAALGGQISRAVETAARIAGVGQEKADRPAFSVTINMGGGHTARLMAPIIDEATESLSTPGT